MPCTSSLVCIDRMRYRFFFCWSREEKSRGNRMLCQIRKPLQVFLLLISNKCDISSVHLAKLNLRCIAISTLFELNQFYSFRNQVNVGLPVNLGFYEHSCVKIKSGLSTDIETSRQFFNNGLLATKKLNNSRELNLLKM